MAPKKKAATIIKNKAFAGRDNLTWKDWRRMTVASSYEAASSLVEDYTGDPIAFAVIMLSQDCTKIENATLALNGVLFTQTGKVIQANRLWQLSEPVKLHFDQIQLDKFRFEGGMVSNLLDASELEYHFIPEREDSVLTDEMLAEQGAENFSLRMFITPINGYTARATTMIYPLGVEQLLDDYPSASCPQFPGICLDRVEIDLGIRANMMTDKQFGQPVGPAVLAPEIIPIGCNTPSSQDLGAAMSALFRRVIVPESKSAHKGLKERWEAIKNDGSEQLRVILPDTLWPETKAPSPQGKHL